MNLIAATDSSASDNLLALLRSNSATSADATSSASRATDTAPSSSTTAKSGPGPATLVGFSDHAKAQLARAKSDQAAATQLQSFVAAHRVNGTGRGTKATATDSLRSILDANTQSTGTQPVDTQRTTGRSKIDAIVAQITTLADANEPQPFQLFTPTRSLSNSVTFNGYTLTLSTNAGTQYYGIELSGNGVQADSKHFGPSASCGGCSASPPGVWVGGGIANSNNQAEDAITITQNLATASSASTSSSAGSTSTSSVNAQSSSITFLVNYATGQIRVQQSAASVSAQSTLVGPPGSTLSTLA
jgi:hypothetical protein